GQDRDIGGDVVLRELVVQLETADPREVVAVQVEEHVLEELAGRFERRRIARTHTLVDFDQRLFRRVDLIVHERVADERTKSKVVREDNLELLDTALVELVEMGFGDVAVDFDDHFAGLLVDDVFRGHAANDGATSDFKTLEARLLDLLDDGAGELAV